MLLCCGRRQGDEQPPTLDGAERLGRRERRPSPMVEVEIRTATLGLICEVALRMWVSIDVRRLPRARYALVSGWLRCATDRIEQRHCIVVFGRQTNLHPVGNASKPISDLRAGLSGAPAH